jgi:hypothetical protein
LTHLLESVGRFVPAISARADNDTDQEGARHPPRVGRFDLERGQASDSVARLTARAGTTVEIACL